MRSGPFRIIAFASVIASSSGAQGAASLAINAGSATDVTGAGSSALTIAPSFTRGSALSSATFSASATKFANQAWSAGAATALAARGSQRIAPVLDVSLSAATTSYDFSYATADVLPSIEARAGTAKIFAGARFSAAGTSSTLGGATGPIPVPNDSRTTMSHTSRTAIGGVSISSVAKTGEVATVGYRGETGVVAHASQIEHTVNGALANSKVMFGGSVGTRVRAGESKAFGVATVGVAVQPTMMLQLSAGTYPANPMIGTAAGKFVNAGITMRLGRRAGDMPAPSGVHAPAPGVTRVAIRANDARRVELAGDFNKWQPIAATRAGNGVWYVDLNLPAGEYRYAFRIDGKEWRVPEGVAAADDEFGGKSAWLTVSRPGSVSR